MPWTSDQAWAELTAPGNDYVNKKEQEVWIYLVQHGPSLGVEMDRDRSVTSHSLHKRIAHMAEPGRTLVEPAGSKRDSKTGREGILWKAVQTFASPPITRKAWLAAKAAAGKLHPGAAALVQFVSNVENLRIKAGSPVMSANFDRVLTWLKAGGLS